MKFVLSVDDYHPQNIKLAKIIKSYGLEKNTIFFIDLANGWAKQVKKLNKMGFEIGNHTVHHYNDLKDMDYSVQIREVQNAKVELEAATGKDCRYYCYCRGRFNGRLKGIVQDGGYLKARTTRVLVTDEPADDYEWDTSCHFYERKDYNGKDWLDVAKETFEEAKRKNGYWHGWGHYFELSRPGEMDKFKEILKYISETR